MKKNLSYPYIELFYLKYCPVYLPWFSRKDSRIVKLKKVELKKAQKYRYSQGKQIKLILDILLWPFITFIYSLLYVYSKKGKFVKKTEKISILRQLTQQIYIANRHNIHPKNYYSHRLYKRNNLENLHYYFFHPLLSGLIEEINKNADVSILSNKIHFENHCIDNNLPTIPIYATVNNGLFFKRNNTLFSGFSLPKKDLFIKPADSLLFPYGSGAESWLYKDQYWIHNDKKLPEPLIIEYLRKKSKTTEYIIMHRVKNHPQVMNFTNKSLSTIRIVTLLFYEKTAKPLFAFLRMPVNDMEIDNVSSGGMYTNIKLDGSIGKGMFNDVDLGEYSIHPNSGIQFEGEKYPLFSEILELCIKAHQTLPQIKSIGWDIALTEDGIIIVEGNNNWGEPASTHKPLGLTAFTDWALSILD